MGCFPCSTIIPIFAIVIIIILVFFQKKTENFNSEPFPGENCESLKKKNNIDCKCVRKYDSHNQCTTKINCVESTSEISGYEENYAPFNPPIEFTNWIKEKTTNRYLDTKTIHTYISKECLYKNGKFNHGIIGESDISEIKPKNISLPPDVPKENVVQSNYYTCKMN